MQFQKDRMYHVFNQGNNRRRIFFHRENYLFFLKKLNIYVLPYADVLAWCLMPNHFHLMIRVREVEVVVHTENHGVTPSHPVIEKGKQRTLNQSLAILLRSYTRAINKQENFSGALFREGTKAECLNCIEEITPSFFSVKSGTEINVDQQQFNYPQVCFSYIHQNPVKAGLVKQDIDWEFSSARDYYGNRKGKLVNRQITQELLGINLDSKGDFESPFEQIRYD